MRGRIGQLYHSGVTTADSVVTVTEYILRRAKEEKKNQESEFTENSQFVRHVRLFIRRHIVSTPWFHAFILFAIFINSICLAADDPRTENPLLEQLELWFGVIFFIEMLLKWTASGLWHHAGYFKSGWNVLDFIIVVTSSLNNLPAMKNFRVVRVLRVLRPLRAANSLKGLRIIIDAIFQSLFKLSQVSIVALFVMVLYAIVGVKLWKGILHFRCYDNITHEIVPGKEIDIFCGEGGRLCPFGQVCLKEAANPTHGMVSFDNFPLALLTWFEVCSLVDWTKPMYFIFDAWSWRRLAFPVFFTYVIAVAFCCINLVLAVITMAFEEICIDEERNELLEKKFQEIEDEKKYQMDRKISSMQLSPSRQSSKRSDKISKKVKELKHRYSLKSQGSRLENQTRLQLLNVQKSPKKLAPPATATASAKEIAKIRLYEKRASLKACCATPHTVSLDFTSCDYGKRRNIEGEHRKRIKNIARDLSDLTLIKKPPNEDEDSKRLVYKLIEQEMKNSQPLIAYLNPHNPSLASTIKIHCYHICESKPFNLFVVLLILWNTISMAIEHHNMPKIVVSISEYSNMILIVCFSLEMIIKLLGYGVRTYFRCLYNAFDAVIVIAGWIDNILFWLGFSFGDVQNLGHMLKTFRLLRIFKLANNVDFIRILMSAVYASGSKVLYVTSVLMLFLFMFAVLGVQLFSNAPKENPHRSGFSSFGWAFFTCFQVLTADDWVNVMTGSKVANDSYLVVIFFISLFIGGSYIIISLFICILLENFTSQDDETLLIDKLSKKAHELAMDVQMEISDRTLREQREELLIWVREEKKNKRASEKVKILEEYEKLRMQSRPRPIGRSLGIFAHDNKLRVFIAKLCVDDLFLYSIMVLIILSSVFLILEKDWKNTIPLWIVHVFDIIFVIVFTIEMVMKIFSFGFYRGTWGYLKDPWNIMDAVVLLGSYMTYFFPGFKVVRSFRVFRPLRVISRNPDIKMILHSLYHSLPALFHVFIFCSLFWIVFAILGVQLFAGKFNYCDDPTFVTEEACLANTNNKTKGWLRYPQNFDNTLLAFMTLFQCSTLSGWAGVAYTAVDAVDVGIGPIKNNRPIFAAFFILFVIICSFFSLSLFVGAFLDTYLKLKHRSTLLTPTETRALQTMKLRNNIKLRRVEDPPQDKNRKIVWQIVINKYFDSFIHMCIILNTTIICLDSYEQSRETERRLGFINNIFLGIFTIELGLKIYGRTFRRYWSNKWNRYDLLIVFVSIIMHDYWGFMPKSLGGGSLASAFRSLRLVRLVRQIPALYRLINTIMISFFPLLNVTILLFVVFSVYSILAMDLYGNVRLTNDGLTRHANFQTYTTSMITLFRMSTGDAWHEILNGCVIRPPLCDQDLGDCGHISAYLFFLSFEVLVGILLLNLFIVVVLENFNRTSVSIKQWIRLKEFVYTWNSFDPRAKGVVTPDEFIQIIANTKKPFGFGKRQYKRSSMLNFLRNSPDHNGHCYWIPIHVVRIGEGETKYYIKFDEAMLQLAKNIGKMDVNAINYANPTSIRKFKGKCRCNHFMHEWFACTMIQRQKKKNRTTSV